MHQMTALQFVIYKKGIWLYVDSVPLHMIYFLLSNSASLLQRKRVKRKKSKGRKNPTAAETTPEELEETWGAVAEELRATSFQVTVGDQPWGSARGQLTHGAASLSRLLTTRLHSIY